MKAILYQKYGPPEDVLQLREVKKPVPKNNEVLIKVHAATVNRTDTATIRAIPFFARFMTGLFKPKKQTPGTEFAGIIESVDKGVKQFKKGDRVFGFDDQGSGSQAQYLAISEDRVVTMPRKLTYEQAAASSEGAHYAYNIIKKVNVKRGDPARHLPEARLMAGGKVLVNGGTGAIGSAAVQLLKHFGAEVTAVCKGKDFKLVKSLGADKLIDYTKEDFTQHHRTPSIQGAGQAKDKEKYDFVFDAVGKSSFFKCYPLLKPGGIYISSDLGFLYQNIFLPFITPIIGNLPAQARKKTAFAIPTDIKGTLVLIKELIEKGKFKALIDRKYPLEKIVKAYKYVEKGQKIGNVVITVKHNNKT